MVPSGREEIVYMKELWGIAQKLVITFELLNLCVFSVSSWINPLARSHFENRHLICKFSYDSLLTQKNTKSHCTSNKGLKRVLHAIYRFTLVTDFRQIQGIQTPLPEKCLKTC